MRKYIPSSIAALIITIGVASGTSFAGGKHHPENALAIAPQAGCTFNAVPVEGADAEPLYWGACSDEQVSLGGTTVTLVVVP